MRDGEFYYVDKTAHVKQMLNEGKHYLLSRPRRFGKSLLLDTIKELFEGNEELFEGLDIHDEWDWTTRHPVLRLDFGGGLYKEPDGLRVDLLDQLTTIGSKTGMPSKEQDATTASLPVLFRRLIEGLYQRTGRRVVLLVDEYDKPILDALDSPEQARINRDLLRGLYANIKFADAHIRFTLLAGVSKFSKVSLCLGVEQSH